jgi:CxxC-x17-CxxC domain-containing protein
MQPKLVDSRTGQTQQVCVDCGEPFAHTAREIAARRGTGLPVSSRCPACRIARREERNARIIEFLRSGDLRDARPAAVGPADAADRVYPAVCSGCQRPIRLPFKPRLDRPVYCRFCHDARNGR